MSDVIARVDTREEIIQELYDRLRAVRSAIDVKVPVDDEFEAGINCRLANEELWLETLISKIEWS